MAFTRIHLFIKKLTGGFYLDGLRGGSARVKE